MSVYIMNVYKSIDDALFWIFSTRRLYTNICSLEARTLYNEIFYLIYRMLAYVVCKLVCVRGSVSPLCSR